MWKRLVLYAVAFVLTGYYSNLHFHGPFAPWGKARSFLDKIGRNQECFLDEHGRYARNLGELGIAPSEEDTYRYDYRISTLPDGQGYLATAEIRPRGIPAILHKEVRDVWAIEVPPETDPHGRYYHSLSKPNEPPCSTRMAWQVSNPISHGVGIYTLKNLLFNLLLWTIPLLALVDVSATWISQRRKSRQ